MTTFCKALFGSLFATVPMLSVETAAQDFNDAVMGYAYANRTAPPPTYVPEAIYNTTGGSAQVDHLGAGVFDVTLFGLGFSADGGIVLVTQTANTLHSCSVDGWESGGGQDFVAGVRCFEFRFGTPSSTQFNLLFVNADGLNIPGLAYAWAFDDTSSTYDASGDYAYNAGGGAITAARTGMGEYTMTFEGITGASGGHVQVSPNGSIGALCRVAGWTGDTVSIDCYDVDGGPVDTQYTVLYLEANSPVEGLGYMWAEQPTTPSYSPDPFYAYNGAGGGVGITRFTFGANPNGYAVEFGGLGSDCCTLAGHVQISTYGTDPNLCVMGSGWTSWLEDFTAPLRCFGTNEQTVDSEYGVLVVFPDQTSVAIEPDSELPSTSRLYEAYPNPFNGSTRLRYDIEESGHVRIRVFDMLGREVAELLNGRQAPGTYEIGVDAGDLPAGTYLLRMESGGKTHTESMSLIR